MSWFNLYAQTGTIKGNVFDNREQKGLAYASIILTDKKDFKKFALSDDDGNFLFDKIPVGIYSIKVTYIGYADTTLAEFKLMADSVVSINLNLPPPCKYDASINNKTCPKCHKKNKVIPIRYGMLISINGDDPLKNEGKTFKLGGCNISYCDPHWYCKRDKIKFWQITKPK